jgi:hypothetical protein
MERAELDDPTPVGSVAAPHLPINGAQAAQPNLPRRLTMTKQELHAQYGPKLVCPLPGPKAKAAVEADTG